MQTLALTLWLCAVMLLAVGCSGGARDIAAEPSASMDAATDAPPDAATSTSSDAATASEHYVVQRSCEEQRYGQGIEFAPLLCEAGRVCLRTECRRPEDCVAQPFARCLASGDGLCFYQGVSSVEPCISDSECMTRRGGHCMGSVSWAACQYNNQCATDSDCPEHHVCACGSSGDLFCAFVECSEDADCGSGERCLRTNPCGWGPFGDFRCTTPNDECEPYADSGCKCDFDRDESRWMCTNVICD